MSEKGWAQEKWIKQVQKPISPYKVMEQMEAIHTNQL